MSPLIYIMTKSHSSENTKLLVIKRYNKGNITQSELAEIFDVNVRTIKRWIKNYKLKNNLSRESRIAVSYKIKQKHVNFVLQLIKKNQQWSINTLWNEMNNKFYDFNISKAHLSDVIRDNNITRKRTRQRHYPITRYGKPINYKKDLSIFYKITDKYSIHKIICIDETSINAHMPSSYSRCELGKRCVYRTTDNKVFKKFTLVCAIMSKGVIGWILYENGGMTADRMNEFISQFINNKLKKCLIIMDNGGPHKRRILEKLLKIMETLYSIVYHIDQKLMQLKAGLISLNIIIK